MKRYAVAVFAVTALLVTGSPSMAQDKKEKDKDKDKEKVGQYDEIIIRKKTDKDDKVTIEIKDGQVTVNGKPIEDYDSDNLSIRKRKTPVMVSPSPFRRNGGTLSFGDGDDMFAEAGRTRAFLGVTTDRVSNDNGGSEGAVIRSISKNSAAEKAGLKKGDIITRIDDVEIEGPEDLSAEIRKRKPEEKVLITIKRDGKEQKINATLGKTTSGSYSFSSPRSFSIPPMDGLKDFNFDFDGDNFRSFNFSGKGRLGIKAQDTEDDKGAKVLDVAGESAAEKAGIKEDDVITEFDGKAIKGADDLAEAAQASKEKPAVTVKFLRNGKQQTVEIKTPKKLKTANL